MSSIPIQSSADWLLDLIQIYKYNWISSPTVYACTKYLVIPMYIFYSNFANTIMIINTHSINEM